MENRKKEIDELIKKLDEMIQAEKTKTEIERVIEKLNQLLKKYLGE